MYKQSSVSSSSIDTGLSSSSYHGHTKVSLGFEPKYHHGYKEVVNDFRRLPIKSYPPIERLFPVDEYRPATIHEKRVVQNRINSENARRELYMTMQSSTNNLQRRELNPELQLMYK